jgi:hypothetical protein
MLIKPAPGLQVRNPRNPRDILPEAGRNVSDTDLEWVRLLNHGDVVIATEPVAEPAEVPAAPAHQE